MKRFTVIDMTQLKVSWFDPKKGLGEAAYTDGRKVLIRYHDLVPAENFVCLAEGDTIECFVEKIKGNLIARKVRRKER